MKKIMIYAIMAVLAVSAIIYLGFFSHLQTGKGSQIANLQEARARFEEQFCNNSDARSNDYITEYKIPSSDCSLPVGIAADRNGKIWFAATRPGNIVMFDPLTTNYKEFKIPQWPRENAVSTGSQVWRLRFDNDGNLWFTDEKQNSIWRFFPSSGRFEQYLVPRKESNLSTIYPIDIDFDKSGNPYFVGIRSKELWIADKSLLENGTSRGISSISIPVKGFQRIDPSLISVGSLAIDKNQKSLWLSLLAFNVKGQLLKYDLATKEFSSYELPEELKSPVGLLLDNKGNLWVTDHGTSIFFKFNTDNGRFTQYTTSLISKRVFGGKQIDAYTLPYWITSGSDGSIWINEHIGNRMAKFDPDKEILTEYWIPTQNPKYSQCADTASGTECGIANALQFIVDSKGDAWFTEWTENKISVLRANIPVPLNIKTSDGAIVAKRGESKAITVELESSRALDTKVDLVVAGTFTSTGGLGNSTAIFSQNALHFDSPSNKKSTLVITPALDTRVGEYTLMIGAEYGDLVVSKAVKISIIQ